MQTYDQYIRNISKLPEVKNKISESLSGRKFYNNGKINKRIKIGDPIPEGFIEGKLPTKLHNVEGRIWVNNGIISKMVRPDNFPDGFVNGRL